MKSLDEIGLQYRTDFNLIITTNTYEQYFDQYRNNHFAY